MKIFTTLVFIISVLLLCGCYPIKEPEYRGIQNFKLGKIEMGESTVKMDVVFLNPNNTAFKIKNTELDIYINDSLVGHTGLDSIIKVQKLSEFILPVSARIKTASLLSNAFSFLMNKEAIIKISGTIKAGVGGLVKNFKINYEARQKIN